MATKTLSVDEEAYRKLARARRHPKESFSQVIKRAEWDAGKPRCGNLLARTCGLPLISEEALDRLDRAQSEDQPPESKWRR
ncbi:MAG: antitoxin VapB family protein [Terrimicrobiaceae bacterium]